MYKDEMEGTIGRKDHVAHRTVNHLAESEIDNTDDWVHLQTSLQDKIVQSETQIQPRNSLEIVWWQWCDEPELNSRRQPDCVCSVMQPWTKVPYGQYSGISL